MIKVSNVGFLYYEAEVMFKVHHKTRLNIQITITYFVIIVIHL